MENLSEIIQLVTNYFLAFGYIGIFVLMFIESSFVPFPSEIVMIPAGYFSATGELNPIFCIMVGTLASLAGAWLNYFISLKLGRAFLMKYKIVSEKNLKKSEKYFENHGAISTFVGRLLPIIRQYISIPAGISKMNFVRFSAFTTLGASIWVTILVVIGYFIGDNRELIEHNLHLLKFLILFGTIFVVLGYFGYKKIKNNDSK